MRRSRPRAEKKPEDAREPLFEGWLADLVEHSLPGAQQIHIFLEDNPHAIRKTVIHHGGKFYDIGAYAREVVVKNDEIVAKTPDVLRVPGIPDDVEEKLVEADREFDRMIRQVASRIVDELKIEHMKEWADAWILKRVRRVWAFPRGFASSDFSRGENQYVAEV